MGRNETQAVEIVVSDYIGGQSINATYVAGQ